MRKPKDLEAAWSQAQRLRAFIAEVRNRAEQLGKDVSPEGCLGRWHSCAEECAARQDPIDRLSADLHGGS